MNYLNGKSATAFFVSGRAPGFSTPGSMPRVRSVFKKVGPMKISNGTVSIPSTSFIESGWSKYNYLQVIVHNPSQKTVGIRNLDGSVPYGQTWLKPNDFAAFNNIRVYFVKKDRLGRGTLIYLLTKIFSNHLIGHIDSVNSADVIPCMSGTFSEIETSVTGRF